MDSAKISGPHMQYTDVPSFTFEKNAKGWNKRFHNVSVHSQNYLKYKITITRSQEAENLERKMTPKFV